MRTLLLAMAIVSPLAAETRLVGPANVPAYQPVKLKVATDLKDTGVILDVFPGDKATVERFGEDIRVYGPPGKYTVKVRVISFASKAIEEASLVVSVGEAGPDDPVRPVDPVRPDPVLPVTDPLVKSLQAALDKDTEADKLKLSKGLANVYEVGASDDILNNVKTIKQLFDAMGPAANLAGISGKIKNTQQAARDYVATKVNLAETTAITEERRKTIKDEFTRVVKALRSLK